MAPNVPFSIQEMWRSICDERELKTRLAARDK